MHFPVTSEIAHFILELIFYHGRDEEFQKQESPPHTCRAVIINKSEVMRVGRFAAPLESPVPGPCRTGAAGGSRHLLGVVRQITPADSC
ncbi:hypothetical protein J6590_047649 [Homalodisca vitripennis]|nr:hypothetical protein J6590_047649 [Homalodisca vitripennis]